MKLQTLKSRLTPIHTSRIVVEPLTSDRMRGRAAVERRARWLDRNPLCVMCQAENPPRVTAATVPDHRIPLWKGGPDIEENLQSLCKEHHDEKSKREAAERSRGG